VRAWLLEPNAGLGCGEEERVVKVTVVLGSRNPTGQTAKAAGALAEGVEGAGGHVERVFLPQAIIERCRQCDDNGWGTCRSDGHCVIGDDLERMVDQIRGADAAVFATPVYFGDLSESIRAFLDRTRRITRHQSGKQGLDGKPAVGICVAGGGGGGAPACAVSLEKVLRTIGFDVTDVIPVRRQNLGLKMALLRTTGRWLAEQRLSVAGS
jgi:multimeric flavodoxin WrbA